MENIVPDESPQPDSLCELSEPLAPSAVKAFLTAERAEKIPQNPPRLESSLSPVAAAKYSGALRNYTV
jgi:hypothetical protein